MKETKNIRLRALKDSDICLLHKWVNDPEVVKYTYFFHPVSEMEQKDWFASLHKQKNKVLFGIEIVESEKLIGTCGLNGINHICRKAELFMKISDKSSWGKGYGREVLDVLVDFGFADLNLRKIGLRVLADNERAIRLYKKAGFGEEGLLREEDFVQGEYKDIILMAYFNSKK